MAETWEVVGERVGRVTRGLDTTDTAAGLADARRALEKAGLL
jgi:hypothetical protein